VQPLLHGKSNVLRILIVYL